MTTSVMREYVAGMYPGSWPDRVALMKANQVQAIFVKYFNKDGSPKERSASQNKNNKNNKAVKYRDKNITGVQISIWDIIGAKDSEHLERSEF